MSEGGEKGIERKVETWKPLLQVWAVQGSLVDVLISVLDENHLSRQDLFDRIVLTIEQRSVMRQGADATAASMRQSMLNRYGGVSDEAFKRMLDDLRKQREYLRSCTDLPPTRGGGSNRDLYKALNEGHHAWKEGLGEAE